MRLRELRTYVCDAHRTNWVLVAIETEDGLTGWGEATLEYRELAVVAAIEALELGLRDRELHDIQGWWQNAYRDAYWRGGPVLTSALSAIEMALWDLKGKALGVPVYQLLGGRVRNEVPCYANGWFVGARHPEEFAEKAIAAVERGYGALKWDPFGAAFRHLSNSDLSTSLKAIEGVVSALGGSAGLIIEAHGRFEMRTALRVARALEDLDIMWLEEPLIPGNLANYSILRDRTSTHLSAGERLYTRWDFRELIQSGAVDVLQPDVSHVGGIWESRVVASLGEMAQIDFSPHNPSGPVANAATMQLAATTPNFTYLETMMTDVPWRRDIAYEASVIINGYGVVSDSPGLGVEIDTEALLRYPYVRHDLRHYTGDLTEILPASAVNRDCGANNDAS